VDHRRASTRGLGSGLPLFHRWKSTIAGIHHTALLQKWYVYETHLPVLSRLLLSPWTLSHLICRWNHRVARLIQNWYLYYKEITIRFWTRSCNGYLWSLNYLQFFLFHTLSLNERGPAVAHFCTAPTLPHLLSASHSYYRNESTSVISNRKLHPNWSPIATKSTSCHRKHQIRVHLKLSGGATLLTSVIWKVFNCNPWKYSRDGIALWVFFYYKDNQSYRFCD
jgi:hypothetical protein